MFHIQEKVDTKSSHYMLLLEEKKTKNNQTIIVQYRKKNNPAFLYKNTKTKFLEPI